jgi:GAF domain-containing protein
MWTVHVMSNVVRAIVKVANWLREIKGHMITGTLMPLLVPSGAPRGPNHMESTVAVPMLGDDEPIGVLLVSRSADKRAFDQHDIDMITMFAAQASLALRLAQARRDNEDLRHRAIQRLYALGLTLQGALPRITGEVPRSTVTAGIDELDAIIREIRASVFSLNPRPSS